VWRSGGLARGDALSRRAIGEALGGKPDGDDRADADLALQIQRSAMELDQGLGQRQAEPGSLTLAIELAVDLAEA
jgi:hypothetical protein